LSAVVPFAHCQSQERVVGFGMRVLGVPVAPAVIGLILGPLAEAQFRRALSISQGDWTVFFTDTLSLALLIIAALALLGPLVWHRWGRRREVRHA
jgi:putative tricarboxylic transport membrane protein